MAASIKLTDGITSYELVYNAVTQADYLLQYGTNISIPEPNTLWHQPDDAPRIPIRSHDTLRQAVLTLVVEGSTWDEVVNNVNKLKLMVDGAGSQAQRYHMRGDVNEVRLEVQLDGATNKTKISVYEGTVDDSGAYYSAVASVNTLAWNVVLVLTIAEYGEMDSQVIRNDLRSSPHMLEDSNADGLADGWNLYGTPTVSIATNRYLIGNSSQKFTTDTTTDEGIQSDTATVAASTNVVASFWLKTVGDPVTVVLRDNTGVIQNKVFEQDDVTSITDKIVIGGFNNETWYRVSLSGTTGATATSYYVQVRRTSSNATQTTQVWVDSVYMSSASSTPPDAFVSTKTVLNRYDPTSTGEDRINYLDLYGVPGDAPALVDHKLDVTSATNLYHVYVAKQQDGRYLSANMPHWRESNDISTFAGGSYVADWARTDGTYFRMTRSAAGVNFPTLNITATWTETIAFAEQTHNIYLIARTSNINTTIEPYTATKYFTHTGGKETFKAINTWELIPGGTLNPIDTRLDLYNTTTGDTVDFLVTMTTSGTTDIDAVLFLPTNEDNFILCNINDDFSTTAGTSDNMYLLGKDRKFLNDGTLGVGKYGGNLWTVQPGNTMSRYIYAYMGKSNQHTLTDSADITLTVTPRTRHLIGTI